MSPHPSKRRGDRFELKVQGILQDELGMGRRKLGAGRTDDTGDIDGLPNTVIQCADWKDLLTAVREKPLQCEIQQERDGALFGATFLGLRGGQVRVVLTVPQFLTLWREAQPVPAPPSLLDTAVTRLRSA